MNITIKWTAALGTIATLIAIGTSLGGWQHLGWVTPVNAKAAHETIEQGHAASDQAIHDFREEWKCDEYDEELEKLRRRLNRAEAGSDNYVEMEHKIKKIEKKMDKINCSRFEDFG
jgi:hypothetical protein